MARYVLLMKADRDGSARLLRSTTGLMEVQKAVLEGLGATVEQQYLVMGHYDIVTVANFPEDADNIAMALAFAADGYYTESLRAYRSDEATSAIDKVKEQFRTLAQDDSAGDPQSRERSDSEGSAGV